MELIKKALRAGFVAAVISGLAFGGAQAIDRPASDCEFDPPTYPGVACTLDDHCRSACLFYDAFQWICEEGCCVCAV